MGSGIVLLEGGVRENNNACGISLGVCCWSKCEGGVRKERESFCCLFCL